MTLFKCCRFLMSGALALMFVSGMLVAQDSDNVSSVDAANYQKVVSKAIQYLENNQADNGSFSEQLGPAVTAMCTTALLKNGVPVTSPSVKKGLSYLESFIRSDGGVYAPDSNLRNYETSVAVMCFVAANQDALRLDIDPLC